MTDQSDSVFTPRKRCPKCAHENRLGAKVCTQCGYVFESMKSRGQKWCPRCGTANKLEAKVCIQCGHRFRSRFNTPSVPPLPAEPPVTQTPSEGIELPSDFDPSRPLPIPKPPPKPIPPPPPAPIAQDTPSEGEPAPDITDIDYDLLRRTGKKDR
jgi:hypothetical protein